MVRIIMAAVGVLCICLGGGSIGVLLLLPAVITVVVKAIDRKSYEEEMAEKARQERLAEENRKIEAIEQQNKLTEQYKNSPLIKEVIDVMSDGYPHTNVPETITIFNNCIQGKRCGKTFTYDFATNRVHFFGPVIRTVNNQEEFKYVVRPQIAMAEAINSFLGNEYEIYDNAKQDANFHTDIDGDSYTTITYISDHVTMVLKSTLPNKHF